MHRFRRIGRVAVLGMLGVVGLITQANAARDAIREFPTGEKCPVHFGPVANNDPLVFTAAGATAKLTFLTCSDRGTTENFANFDAEATNLNISLDRVMVVERTVFDNNRLLYPTDFVANSQLALDYGIAVQYPPGPNGVCYNTTQVQTVFDHDSVGHFTKAMPFYDDFEGQPQAWELVNASIDVEGLDADRPGRIPPSTRSKSLILAREGPDQYSGTCSSASIRVNNLIKTRQYVVDFSWFIQPAPNTEFDQRSPRVTVALQ